MLGDNNRSSYSSCTHSYSSKNIKFFAKLSFLAFIMRKQTKLVAVLSAAALLAIGASMTSFAKGWTEEDGEWVYLDSDGERVTQEWKKSGNIYYWLDEDDGDTFYYYFDKTTGAAIKNTVKDGLVYGPDGARIQAEDGNSNAIVTVEEELTYSKGNIPAGSQIIVSSSGKLRTSGTVKVDGVKYVIGVNDNGLWIVTPDED